MPASNVGAVPQLRGVEANLGYAQVWRKTTCLGAPTFPGTTPKTSIVQSWSLFLDHDIRLPGIVRPLASGGFVSSRVVSSAKAYRSILHSRLKWHQPRGLQSSSHSTTSAVSREQATFRPSQRNILSHKAIDKLIDCINRQLSARTQTPIARLLVQPSQVDMASNPNPAGLMPSVPAEACNPAPYGRACVGCPRAKSKCFYRVDGSSCERFVLHR